MISTCTMNPSLDYYLNFDQEIRRGQLSRSVQEAYKPGGKGINVSIVLNNLGIPSRAFGFLGGFTKDYFINLLAKYEMIRPNFTYIQDNTRINLKLDDGEPMEINARGPHIKDADMENLAGKVERLFEGEYFVLAGNTPDYLFAPTAAMLKKATENGVNVVLDTAPVFMKDLLGTKPFLVKTTPAELAELTGQTCTGDADIVKAAKWVSAAGARKVLVVDGYKAVLVDPAGTYAADLADATMQKKVVGTGDSVVAGFLMDYLRSRDALDAFRFGAAAGRSTALSEDLAAREEIERNYENVAVHKIDA